LSSGDDGVVRDFDGFGIRDVRRSIKLPVVRDPGVGDTANLRLVSSTGDLCCGPNPPAAETGAFGAGVA
jgi:imidazole glycerol phosphate synthase subunit HisF